MRVSKDRIENTLNKIGNVMSVICIIGAIEFTGVIIYCFMIRTSIKFFLANMACLAVIATFLIIINIMYRRLKFQDRDWVIADTKKYKYTNVKWFNLTQEIVSCVNNGTDEQLKFDYVYTIIPDPEDNTPFSSYVTREIYKYETTFLWWIIENEVTCTILHTTEEEYNREKELEDEEKEERRRQALKNEYQIIC